MNMNGRLCIKQDNGRYRIATPDEVLTEARSLLYDTLQTKVSLSSPRAVREYLSMKLASLEHEVFHCLFLDSQNRLIASEDLFQGTIDGAAVYPREVVKKVLHHNSSSVIIAHNHPSGVAEPSQADHRITERLQKALALIDVRILDHLVIGEGTSVSFAEQGWL